MYSTLSQFPQPEDTTKLIYKNDLSSKYKLYDSDTKLPLKEVERSVTRLTQTGETLLNVSRQIDDYEIKVLQGELTGTVALYVLNYTVKRKD